MSRHLQLATQLSVAELEQRSRAAHEPHERSGWQILWLLARGQTATAIADTTGYTRGWIGQIAKRYNDQGPDALVNRQHTTSWRAPRMLWAQQQEELRVALTGPAPDGAKRWRARDVADGLAARLGRPVATQRGWDSLQRLKHSPQVPRPRHALAESEQQADFKKSTATAAGGGDRVPAGAGRAVGNGGDG
jgi:transposase